MKIAIHQRENSFSERWLELCRERNFECEQVDCLSNDVISRLSGADILLWHWHQNQPPDKLVARHVIRSAETMGLLVFPNSATCWSFDDKLAQKYLLESIGAPLSETHAFFRISDAMEWLEKSQFPQVFKLRCGAGSTNVRLVEGADEGKKLIRQAFLRGFPFRPSHFVEARDHMKKRKAMGPNIHGKRFDVLGKILRYIKRSAKARALNRQMGNEIGYVIFQQFIPDNTFDTRITVIGDRAFAFTRNVRRGDWRASGSGDINYDMDIIDPSCIEIAFITAAKLKCQSIAFDFVKGKSGEQKILEISYAYNAKAVYDCPGYWSRGLTWTAGHVFPQDAIFDDMLAKWHGLKKR